MKKIILLILLCLFLVPFILAQGESNSNEFTLAVGEEKVFTEQKIIVELRSIKSNFDVPSGYDASVEIYLQLSKDGTYAYRTLWIGGIDDSRPIYLSDGNTVVKIDLASINSEQATFKISFGRYEQDLDECLQQCEESMKGNCAVYPNSPLCPEDIARRCESNCRQDIVLLNEEFPLKIGGSIIVEDYDNMKIGLLSIDKTGKRKYIANLRVTKGKEVELVSIDAKKSKMVFGVRIDFVSFVAESDTKYFNEEHGVWVWYWDDESAEPSAGLFGVHERGSSNFWDKVARWFKSLFGG